VTPPGNVPENAAKRRAVVAVPISRFLAAAALARAEAKLRAVSQVDAREVAAKRTGGAHQVAGAINPARSMRRRYEYRDEVQASAVASGASRRALHRHSCGRAWCPAVFVESPKPVISRAGHRRERASKPRARPPACASRPRSGPPFLSHLIHHLRCGQSARDRFFIELEIQLDAAIAQSSRPSWRQGNLSRRVGVAACRCQLEARAGGQRSRCARASRGRADSAPERCIGGHFVPPTSAAAAISDREDAHVGQR